MDKVVGMVQSTAEIINKTKNPALKSDVEKMIIRFFDLTTHIDENILQGQPCFAGRS